MGPSSSSGRCLPAVSLSHSTMYLVMPSLGEILIIVPKSPVAAYLTRLPGCKLVISMTGSWSRAGGGSSMSFVAGSAERHTSWWSAKQSASNVSPQLEHSSAHFGQTGFSH